MLFKQITVLGRRTCQTYGRYASYKADMRQIGVGGYALLTIPIATFCLGTWQVKRRSWKLNLIKDVEKSINVPVIDFPEELEKLSELEYRRVRVRGTFDHSKEMYIGPRQLITKEESAGGSVMSSRPKSGYLVITPFHMEDKNLTILVNRGWVSKENIDPSSRINGQVEGELDLIGTVRLPEKRPPFCPKDQHKRNYFLFRNVPKMAELVGSEPIYLDADADSSIPEGPVGGQTRITFRNDHFSYIITWYGLSAATSYAWYVKYIRRARV